MALQMDGYIRVSRVGGRSGESFISPDEQREQIQAWAKLRGVTIVEWHTDLDQTGGVLRRPGLDALMARIKARETGGVAVAYLDRLSRADVGDALRLVEEIHDAGGQLAAIDLGIDPTTPFGEFAMTLMLALARMQRRRISETWRSARSRAVARGVHIASRTPTGYRRDATGRLEPHETAAAAIKVVFQRRADGASWAELSRHLDEQGVAGPYDAAHWTPRAVEHMIRNRAYLGEARHGEFRNASAHEPLVDRALWERAQRVQPLLPGRSSTPSLLSGLLRCAGCRHLMKADKMKARDGSKRRIYRCRGHHSSGICVARPAVLASVIEPWIEQQARDVLRRTAFERVDTDEQVEALRILAEQAHEALAEYRDDERVQAALGSDRFVEGLTIRAERADRAEEAYLVALAEHAPGAVDAAELVAMWDAGELDVRDKQLALRSLFDAVFLRRIGQSNLPIGDRTLIFSRGAAPPDLPGRGRRGVAFAPLDWAAYAPPATRVTTLQDPDESVLER